MRRLSLGTRPWTRAATLKPGRAWQRRGSVPGLRKRAGDQAHHFRLEPRSGAGQTPERRPQIELGPSDLSIPPPV